MKRQHQGYMDWSPKNKNVYDSTFGVGGGYTLLAMFDTRFQLDDTPETSIQPAAQCDLEEKSY